MPPDPLAVNVAEVPEQIGVAGLAVAAADREEAILTVTLLVAVQP